MLVISFKRLRAKPIDFGISIISIGNIIVGGSGKTPLTIFLAKRYENVAVILRGYGRESKGLYVVSQNGEIKVDVKTSGDEAMLLANSLKNATIIVSEDRKKAILKAKELGCKIIFLDDGFSKYDIKKFDILIRPKNEPTNIFCLPSGGYREPKMNYSLANLQVIEGSDFKRKVSIVKNEKIVSLPSKAVLLTAISKPKRLFEFLPSNIILKAYPDHYEFTKKDIERVYKEYPNYTILTTAKDYVKLKKFDIPDIYLMNLDIEVNSKILEEINKYINKFF